MNGGRVALGLLVAGLAAAAEAEWRNFGPGGGGWIPCMEVSPHDSRVIFAGCDVGGFYRSDDAGATWTIHNAGLSDLYVECIVPHPRDPAVIYLGTEGGVHKSVDGGRTWIRQGEGFPPPQRFRFSAPIGALAVDPCAPDTLYAGVGRPRQGKDGAGAVWRTTDGGAHWTPANPGGGGLASNAVISALLVHPEISSRLFAATDRGLCRSDDAGATWRVLTNGLPNRHARRVALCAARPEIMYLTVQSEPGEQPWRGGVYRSDDGGETWQPRCDGLGHRVGKPGAPAPMTSNVDRLAVHPTDPDVVYAGDQAWVSAGIYRTTDGGRHWDLVTCPRPQPERPSNMDYGWIAQWGPTVMGLAMDPRTPGSLWFSTSGHIFHSGDGGDSWTQTYTRPVERPAGFPDAVSNLWSGTGLEVTCVHRIAVHPRDPQRLYLGYADIGLLQSFDGGRTFAPTVSGMRCKGNTFTVVFDPDDPGILWAGTGWWDHNEGDVCRSDDGGLTWRVVGEPSTGLPVGQTRHLAVDPSSPAAARRLFVGVNGHGVFATEDGGAHWAVRTNGLSGTEVRGLAVLPGGRGTVFALVAGDGKGGGGLFRSNDAGGSWRRLGGDFACPDPQDLAVCPSDPRRIYIAAREKYADRTVQPGGVFASRDGGATWTHMLKDRFIEALAVDPGDADVLYAGGMDHPYHDGALGSGVRMSRDGGRTWVSLNTPRLTCTKIACLTVDPHDSRRLYAGSSGNGTFVREE